MAVQIEEEIRINTLRDITNCLWVKTRWKLWGLIEV